MKNKEVRMGRPIKGKNPRNKRLSLRISEEEMREIEYCSKELNKTKIDTVMEGIYLLKKEID